MKVLQKINGQTVVVEVADRADDEMTIMREQKEQLEALAEWLRGDLTRLQALKDLVDQTK